MIKYKEVTKITLEPVAIVCDICKKVYTDGMYTQEFVRIEGRGGYYSAIGDDVEYKLDMCSSCFNEKLGDYLILD